MAKFTPPAELSYGDQVQVRRDKLTALQAEGRDPFLQTKYDFNSDSAAIKANYAEMEGKIVKIAGRLMSKRGQGKVSCSSRSTNWVRRSTPALRRMTSATSSA